MSSWRETMSKPRWLLGGLLLLCVVLFSIGLLIGHYAIPSNSPPSPPLLTVKQVRTRIFAEIKPQEIRAHLKITTKASHPAGSPANNAVAQYIKTSLQAYLGADNVREAVYDALLSRPNNSNANRVMLTNADGTLFMTLANKEFDGEFDTAYFGYAPSGTVKSRRLVYANQAREEDFELLLVNGIQVNGSVVIARRGGNRGVQMETCGRYGAVAVLLFMDPSEVAVFGTKNASILYPNGPWMDGSAIERGSIRAYLGDPVTQGFASTITDSSSGRKSYRSPIEEAQLPRMFAVPIGYGDAERLFRLMATIQPLPPSPPSTWVVSKDMPYALGGLLLDGREVTVSLTNYLETSRITNVIATIQGCEEPDRYVLLGNHFDAWTMGGIDPNSGTAVMLELARVLGVLRSREAWCPRRTIIFGAWDAQELGLIGSTEWVEENLQILHDRAVAYINVEMAVYGTTSFWPSAMPLLTDMIQAAAKEVVDASSFVDGQPQQTLYDVWKSKFNLTIGRLGAGSDYSPFVNMIGVTSADLRYRGESSNRISQHTAFDTYNYMVNFVDPTFEYHVAMTKVCAEIVRDLADSTLLPFSVSSLAKEMEQSWDTVRRRLIADELLRFDFANQLDLESLSRGIDLFKKNTASLTDELLRLSTYSSINNPLKVRGMNDRLMKLQRVFLDPNGLPGRPLTRNVLAASPVNNVYNINSTSFAGIMECVSFMVDARKKGQLEEEKRWMKELKLHFVKVAQMVDRSARFLLPPADSLIQT